MLAKYQNGNCEVELYEDGTKIRRWEDEALPEFPESCDLKITNYCDAKCKWCHEQSTIKGSHADLNTIFRMVEKLKPGCEVAIGGGNPFSHPNLEEILVEFKRRELISNITINSFHVYAEAERINEFRARNLIYGVGISYDGIIWEDEANTVVDDNTIIHVIAGIHDFWDIVKLPKHWKILVLGYKTFGFGIKYAKNPKVDRSLKTWSRFIQNLVSSHHVSFDNLALKQLPIREIIGEENWNRLYMGDDGKFTLYADAVKGEWAISSTSTERFKEISLDAT